MFTGDDLCEVVPRGFKVGQSDVVPRFGGEFVGLTMDRLTVFTKRFSGCPVTLRAAFRWSSAFPQRGNIWTWFVRIFFNNSSMGSRGRVVSGHDDPAHQLSESLGHGRAAATVLSGAETPAAQLRNSVSSIF